MGLSPERAHRLLPRRVRHGFCRDGALVFADTFRLSGGIAAALARTPEVERHQNLSQAHS
jgi:hypothetical protein